MIQDFELGEVPQRRYLKQERIDKSRKKCKSRLKNDSSYRLETYMFAMGSYTVKSDLGIISEGQRFNHIENTSHYETILPTPGPGPRLNVNKAKKRNRRQKRKSMNASYLNGTKSRKQSKLVCPVDNKGFNVQYKVGMYCLWCGVSFKMCFMDI